jgi:hypothetical protein
LQEHEQQPVVGLPALFASLARSHEHGQIKAYLTFSQQLRHEAAMSDERHPRKAESREVIGLKSSQAVAENGRKG